MLKIGSKLELKFKDTITLKQMFLIIFNTKRVITLSSSIACHCNWRMIKSFRIEIPKYDISPESVITKVTTLTQDLLQCYRDSFPKFIFKPSITLDIGLTLSNYDVFLCLSERSSSGPAGQHFMFCSTQPLFYYVTVIAVIVIICEITNINQAGPALRKTHCTLTTFLTFCGFRETNHKNR